MTNHQIRNPKTSEVIIKAAHQTWQITASGSVSTVSTAVFMEPAAKGSHLLIDGGVFSDNTTVVSSANASRIIVGTSGIVTGAVGINTFGDDSVVINNGTITSHFAAGLLANGLDNTIINTGTVFGPTGVTLAGEGDKFVNGQGGRVESSSTAVLGAAIFGQLEIVNHGTLIGLNGANAIEGESAAEKIRSDGVIEGDLLLREGDDVVDLRNGSFKGKILTGPGDDMLLTDNPNYKLVEDRDGGVDRVKSSVSYTLSANVEQLILTGKADINGHGNSGANLIGGNAGNNVLRGDAGLDLIGGDKGNDDLFGGLGEDVFFFRTGDGHDTIKDFNPIEDSISLKWKGIDSLSDVIHHAVHKGDLVIIEVGHDSLTIDGINKADLHDVNFIFA